MADNSPLNIDVFRDRLTNYVVTPLNAFGIGGFVFDTEGESTVNLTAEITDHFVEDGATISDHIAIKPKKIILKNYVGELVYRQDDTTETDIQKAVQKLTTVSNFLPEVTDMAQQVLEMRREGRLTLDTIENFNVSKTINRVSDFWALAKNIVSGSSRQQEAYMYFKAMWEQKLLVSVQTPFEFMNSMAIESVTAVQQEGSKYVSDFSITLKQIRTAKEIVSAQGTVRELGTGTMEELAVYQQGRSSAQNARVSNQGNVPGRISEVKDATNELLKSGIPAVNLDALLPPPRINIPINPGG